MWGEGGDCLQSLIIYYLQPPFRLFLLFCHLFHLFLEDRSDRGAQGNHLLQGGLEVQVSQGYYRCISGSNSLLWTDYPEVVHLHKWQNLWHRARQTSWALQEKHRDINASSWVGLLVQMNMRMGFCNKSLQGSPFHECKKALFTLIILLETMSAPSAEGSQGPARGWWRWRTD